MKPSTVCLPEPEIPLLLSGDLPPDEVAAAESHLEECSVCRAAIESMIADSRWWEEAKGSLSKGSSRDADRLDAIDEGGESSNEQLLELLGPTDDPAMLGRIGTYEIVGILGRGGMGVVFKGYDAALNRFVAIKMLLPYLAASGAARKRFAREAQAAAAVVDDHVMAIHGVSEWNSTPYFVMPYSRGLSVQKRISKEGSLEPREILRIGMQAAKGLAAAHSQGLVHRDVKPANIFLDEGVERVQLMDFGLARAVDDASLTRSGMLAGTPQYMSPEQARAEKVDHRSDLFSLGSVLYAMCVGHAPFRAESSYSVLRLITDKEPRPIREINTDIPVWLCAIICKLMSKQPGERFNSAQQVAEILESCLAHVQEPTTTSLPTSVAELAKSFGSHEVNSKPSESLGGFRYPPTWKLISIAAFAIPLLLASIFITIETVKGTITIESEADNVPIVIKKGDKVYDKLTVNRDGKSVRVFSGDYEINFDGKSDRMKIHDGVITLGWGEDSVVRIRVREDLADSNSDREEDGELSDADDASIDLPNLSSVKGEKLLPDLEYYDRLADSRSAKLKQLKLSEISLRSTPLAKPASPEERAKIETQASYFLAALGIGSLGQYIEPVVRIDDGDHITFRKIPVNTKLASDVPTALRCNSIQIGSVAELAGIRPGDILIGLDAFSIESLHDVWHVADQSRRGKLSSEMKAYIVRDGVVLLTVVDAAGLHSQPINNLPSSRFGGDDDEEKDASRRRQLATETISKHDHNNSGELDKKESPLGLQRSFDEIDTDDNGLISVKELTRHYMQSSGILKPSAARPRDNDPQPTDGASNSDEQSNWLISWDYIHDGDFNAQRRNKLRIYADGRVVGIDIDRDSFCERQSVVRLARELLKHAIKRKSFLATPIPLRAMPFPYRSNMEELKAAALRINDPLPKGLGGSSAERIAIRDGDDFYDVMKISDPEAMRGIVNDIGSNPQKAFDLLQKFYRIVQSGDPFDDDELYGPSDSTQKTSLPARSNAGKSNDKRTDSPDRN